ncbi:hypothetical protein [Pseudomonas leptonychotis]|uniref:hypothetical protein n=1 Tax=Pseudomonas leptonychotis TaxID=2448482 RepID=UPI0039F08C0F
MQASQLIVSNPLSIYLDSSDFSYLSNPVGDQEKKLAIKNKIKGWVDAGKVEIRYSMTHIMEALPTQERAMNLARQRLSCIQELCGKKVLLDQITVISDELSPQKKQSVLNDDGCWFPLLAFLDGSFDQDEKAATLNRKERRLLAAELRKSKGDLDLAREQEKLIEKFPVTRSGASKILRNPNNSVVLQNVMIESLSDLPNLFSWHEEHWQMQTEFSNILRESGIGIRDIFIDAARKLKDYYQEQQVLGEPDKVVDQKTKSFLENLKSDALRDLVESLSDERAPPLEPVAIGKETTPMLLILSSLMMHHVQSSVIPRQRLRVPKSSDFGDVMHALYLPYVDFFRADAATAHAIISQRFGFDAQIVTSLDELIHEVSIRLGE